MMPHPQNRTFPHQPGTFGGGSEPDCLSWAFTRVITRVNAHDLPAGRWPLAADASAAESSATPPPRPDITDVVNTSAFTPRRKLRSFRSAYGTATMFHRGCYGRGQDRGSGARGAHGGCGKAGRRPAGGGDRPRAWAWSGKHGLAWNELCDRLNCVMSMTCRLPVILILGGPRIHVDAVTIGVVGLVDHSRWGNGPDGRGGLFWRGLEPGPVPGGPAQDEPVRGGGG